MKVVFKMNAIQQQQAAMLTSVAPRREDEGKWVYCGNVGGMVEDTGYGVSPQSLSVEGTTLVYEGRRTALCDGEAGCMGLILAVFGSKESASKAVVSYETTEKEVPWYFTVADAIGEGLIDIDKLFSLADKFNGRTTGYAAELKLVELAGGYALLKTVGVNPRKDAAQWTSKELAFKHRVGRLVGACW